MRIGSTELSSMLPGGLMGLRTRIMLLVAIGLLVATVPLGVMGLGMVRTATDRVLQERLAMTRATARQLGDRLGQGWSDLDGISSSVASSWNRGDSALVQEAIAAAVRRTLLFSGGIFIVDRSRRIVAQRPATLFLPPGPPPDLSVLHDVMLTGRPRSSGLIRTGAGVPAVIFAVPIFAGPNRVAGVVGGVIDLSQATLSQFIQGLAQGTSGHAAIVDGDGIVLSSTDSQELYTRNEHPDFFARFITEGHPLVGATREDHGLSGQGEVHIMAFAPIQTVPWGLGIGQNEEETFGPMRRLRDRIILFELMVLITALVFAWLDTSAVVTPLRLLKDAAERIAGGDLARQVEVRRPDELGALAHSFEAMRQQLLRSLDENARLQEQVQSVAMVEERERIAREMHDSVGQVLGYVNTKAQAVTALLESGKVREAQAQLSQLEQAARDVYADLREAILGLRLATSPERGLMPTLAEYVRRFGEMSGVGTDLVIEGDASQYAFGPATELHLTRIIQEALTNVRKHSSAHRAWVRFAADDGVVAITVADDGRGFEPTPIHSEAWARFGLHMMQERTEAIGGTLAIHSRRGSGTEVVVRLPASRWKVDDARSAGG